MSTQTPQHLTADELDALLGGAAPERATSHIATCSTCLTMVMLDQQVVAALGTLPTLEPAPGFGDRVMARVAVHQRPLDAAPSVAATPRAVAARRRAMVAGAVAGGAQVAGFAWLAAHPAELLRVAGPVLRDNANSLWLSVQQAASNVTTRPWYGSARNLLATPARAFPVIGAIAAAYALALSGLRRVMTEPVPHARW
jgi:hypothetical protein